MWWTKGFGWFEEKVIELISKLPAVKAYLDTDKDGAVELVEVWEKVKVCVTTADMFVDNWETLTPGQKQEAVCAMVKKIFPNVKDSLIYTLINLAYLGWKIFKVLK